MAASRPFQLQNRLKSYPVTETKWVVTWFGKRFQSTSVIRTDQICLASENNHFKSFVCNMSDSSQTIRFLDVPNDPQQRFQIAVGATGSQCMSAVNSGSGILFDLQLKPCDSSNVGNLFFYSDGLLGTNQTVKLPFYYYEVPLDITLCLHDSGANSTNPGLAVITTTCNQTSEDQLFDKTGEVSPGLQVECLPCCLGRWCLYPLRSFWLW